MSHDTDMAIHLLIICICCFIFGVILGGKLTQSSYKPVDSVRCNGGYYVVAVDYDDGTTTLLETDVQCDR